MMRRQMGKARASGGGRGAAETLAFFCESGRIALLRQGPENHRFVL
jgi:hypothetical protein